MSQTMVVIEIGGNLHEEIYQYKPDREEVLQICIDDEYESDVDADVWWYEIGEGESGTDTFFEEDKLLELYKESDGNTDILSDKIGIDIELIERETYYYWESELNESDC